MKNVGKILLVFFFGIFCFLFGQTVKADEIINNYQVKVFLNANGEIFVEENINYDFGLAQKIGIYRTIPIRYDRNGGNYNIRLSDVSVFDNNKNPIKFRTEKKGDNINIIIGSQEKTITGEQNFQIKYKVRRAINYFDNHDELYWNVTGNGWQVPIEQAVFTVYFPKAVDDRQLQSDCFSGPLYSKEKCQSWRYIFTGQNSVNGAVFTAEKLNPTFGLSAVIGLPKGTLDKPSTLLIVWYSFLDNYWIIFPLLVFAVMFYIWFSSGRDPKGQGTIIVQYDVPDNLTPAEVGTIMDSRADNIDISAEIINLAIKGYIKITRLEERKLLLKSSDFILEKLKSESDLPNEFEKRLMAGLFSVRSNKVQISDLQNKFYKELDGIKTDVYADVTQKGYFSANPELVRRMYLSAGGITSVISFFLFDAISLVAGFSIMAAGMIIIFFGYFMPKRTIKGQKTREYVLGLKQYLSVAEKDRLDFHNAPEKDPQVFEKLLPFAMVLKVEEKWAEQFKDIYTAAPSWYNDPKKSRFNAVIFTHSLASFASNTNSALSSSPSRAGSGGSGLGGGGFSGGGFGGGGGGSW